MLLVIEVMMLAVGLPLLTTGRLPRWVLRRSKRKPVGAIVRWLGLILVLPFPVAFLGGVMLNARLGERGAAVGILWEVGILVVAATAAVLVYRRIRSRARELGTERRVP